MLNRALYAIRRGGGLLMTLSHGCSGRLAPVHPSALGRIAPGIAFMLFSVGNIGTFFILFQIQVEWLGLRLALLAAQGRQARRHGRLKCMKTEATLGTVQPA